MFYQKCTEGFFDMFDFAIDDCLDSWWMCTFRIVHNFSSSVTIFHKKNSYIIWQRNAYFETVGNAVFGEFMRYSCFWTSNKLIQNISSVLSICIIRCIIKYWKMYYKILKNIYFYRIFFIMQSSQNCSINSQLLREFFSRFLWRIFI